MDEPELIQECKSQNRKLIEFCTKRPQLEKIVHYVADVPDKDADEKVKEKYPMLCTDMLCAEVWQFSDAIYNEKDLLMKLYAFLDKNPKEMTMEERRVGDNCARTISSLLLRKGSETLSFLRSYPDVVKKFVIHVCNTNILDYIVKLISADEYYSVSDDPLSDSQSAEDSNAVTWLCEEHFVDLIVDKFIDETDQETQESACMMLYELTTYFSSQCDSPLIQRLESHEIVDKLFKYIITTDHHSTSLCGFSILIELLRNLRGKVDVNTRNPDELPTLVVGLSGHLKECTEFLHNTPPMPPLMTTFGLLDPPLGLSRQSMLELVESLTLTNSVYVYDALLESRFMETAIKLFFEYPWNNFAHQSVFNIIATVLPTTHEGISRHIMEDCHLVEQILEAEERNKAYVRETNAALGYIGHLTVISSLIDNLANQGGELPNLFSQDLQNYPNWGQYMSETVRPRRDKEAKKLGGIHFETGSETDTDGDGVHDVDGEIVRHQCDDDDGEEYSYEGEYDDDDDEDDREVCDEEEDDNSGDDELYHHDEDEEEEDEEDANGAESQAKEESEEHHTEEADSVSSATSEMGALSLNSREELHQDNETTEEPQEHPEMLDTNEKTQIATENVDEPKKDSESPEAPEELQNDSVTAEDSTQ